MRPDRDLCKLVAQTVLILCVLLPLWAVEAYNLANPVVTETVLCHTTAGDLHIEVYSEWAPLGSAHYLALVRDRFYTDIAMYRSQPQFLTQFGISDRPEAKHWHGAQIQDDPNLHIPIQRGMLSFAGGGPNTRSSQIFIAFADLDFLGKEPWETPFGRVVGPESEATLDNIYKGYPEIQPFAKNGPDQQRIFVEGNSYVRENFPLTTFVQSCKVVADPNKETIHLGSEDHRRELTEAPVKTRLRVDLPDKPPRPTFSWTHIVVGLVLFSVLVGVASYRPRKEKV